MTTNYSLKQLSSIAWTPHQYQQNAIKFLLSHAAAGLFLDPGLGKTSIVLGAVKILKAQKLLKRVLVIAPLRVCYGVWPNEARKWLDFNGLRVKVLHGKDKNALVKQDADIYVINPEGLDWLIAEGRLKSLQVDTLVVDESSKFKHTSTKRFKNLKPHLNKFARRWILTGTPAPNGLMDLFGQIFILDLGRSFTPYITKFRLEFFNSVGFGGYTYVPKPGTDERIHELLKPMTLRLEARDYLELPQLIENRIVVELPPAARKIYDEMEQQLFALIDNGEIAVAQTAAAASIKCRQVANGGIYRQLSYTPAVNSDRWQDIHMEKANAAYDLVEELNGQPVLVAYDFEHDKARLLHVFGKDTPYIGGGVSAKRGAEIEAEWNLGNIPVLLVHPAAAGHGLNLQGNCQHVLWHSMTWDLELYEQTIARVLRQGNKYDHVTVHHIIAKDTIDEVMMRALRGKAKVQNRLLTALKEYREVREK